MPAKGWKTLNEWIFPVRHLKFNELKTQINEMLHSASLAGHAAVPGTGTN